MNHAVLYVTPIIRWIWLALRDFLDEHRMKMAMSHLEIGRCESSKTVPTVAVKVLRQAAQPYSPWRAGCFVSGLDWI